MNNIIHNFLLTSYMFMPEMRSRQAGFTYSESMLFAKKQDKNLHKSVKKQGMLNVFILAEQIRNISSII